MTHPACLYSLDYYNVQQTQTHRGAELAGVFPLTLRNAGVMLVQCENQENPRVTPALKVRIWEITDRSQAYVALQEFTASISEYKRTAKQRKSHLVNSAIFPPVLIVFLQRHRLHGGVRFRNSSAARQQINKTLPFGFHQGRAQEIYDFLRKMMFSEKKIKETNLEHNTASSVTISGRSK